MGKSPGKSSSNKIINYKDKGEVAQWASKLWELQCLNSSFRYPDYICFQIYSTLLKLPVSSQALYDWLHNTLQSWQILH